MSHEPDRPDDEELLGLLAALPRTAPVPDTEKQRTIARLRSEGLLRTRSRMWPWLARAVAAVVLVTLGVGIGEVHGRRGSLEDMLARKDLTLNERVLLLQRAGSAYVRAAQGYADATAHVDSSAIEVASHVLMGAAQAIARNNMDAGLNARLASALTPVATPKTKPLIWF